MSGCTIRGGAGVFDTGVSPLALSRIFLVSHLIETAAHQLAPLSTASCAHSYLLLSPTAEGKVQSSNK